MSEVESSVSTVVSARDPRWADQAHTAIVLFVVFAGTKAIYGEMPFAASPNDPEPHGVELYERALSGEFGEVQEPTLEMVQAQVMCERGGLSAAATARINSLVADLDTLQDAVSMKLATEEQIAALPAVQAELDAWRLYRVKLAQLDTAAGYPMSFEWPVPPASPFVYAPSDGDDLSPIQTVDPSELPQ